MKIAVTPFATSSSASAAHGRQFAHLVGESLKAIPGLQVMEVSFMARLQREDREERVMVAGGPHDAEWSRKLLEHLQADAVLDGLLEMGDRLELTLRVTMAESEEPIERTLSADRTEVADLIEQMLLESARMLGHESADVARALGASLRESTGEAVLALLQGWDALAYLRHVGDYLPEDADFEPAFDALVRAVRLDPDYLAPYEALIELTRQCVHLGPIHADVIERSLKTVNELCEDDWRGWYSLGDLYHRMNQDSLALECFEKSLKLNPAEPALWTRLGFTQSSLGLNAEAMKSFEEAISRESPLEPSPTAPAYASLLTKEGRPDEAHALWQRILDRDRTVAIHWINLAMSHESRGESDAALQVLEEALQAVDSPEQVHVHLARTYMHRESHAKALAHYEAAAEALPNQPGLAVELADCLYFCGRVSDAIRVLRDALAQDPGPPIRAALEARRMEMEEPEKLERFRQLTKRLMEGRDEAALFELEQVARWLGDYWPVWEVLARGFNRMEKAEKAEAASRRLLALLPQYPTAYGELAAALFAQGKADEAFRTFRQALRKLPYDPLVLANYGIAAKMLGRDEDAERAARSLDAMGQEELSSRVRAARRPDFPRPTIE
ncbi:MAG: tetratricopeptide repeat protein [Fimbriimonadia bacterium]|jgi:tetratricopeptide (TPR) repeat protein